MTVRVYKSTDVGAPVLDTVAGSLIALLDACLVTGYGSATPAGWTKEYVGTNLAVFKQGIGGNDRYFRFADTNLHYTNFQGYESMTAVSTGVNPFPTIAQFAGGVFHHKGNGSATGARPWIIVADEKFVHLLNYTSPVTDQYSAWSAFGDIPSTKAGDIYNSVVIGCASNSYTVQGSHSLEVSLTTLSPCKVIARKFDQLGTAVFIGMDSDYTKSAGQSTMGNGGLPYPHGPDGGLYLAPVNIHEYNGSVGAYRGYIPGIWNPCHLAPFTSYDTWSGSGDLAGRTFLGHKIANVGGVALETSDTWYS